MFTTLLLLCCILQNPDYDDVPQFVGRQVVAELNTTSNDKSPTLSDDELTVVFASDRPGGMGGYDLYLAQRAHIEAAFGTPVPLTQVNSSGNDDSPQLSFDGLSLYFASDRSGGLGPRDLYVSTRTSLSAQFGPPQNLGVGVNGPGLDNDEPHPTQDGLKLFYSTATSAMGREIMVATLQATGTFGNPAPFAQSSSPANESAPMPNMNGQSVYFVSDRAGGPTTQGYWITSFDNVTRQWTTPSPIATLSTSDPSGSGWRGGVTQRLYYSRYVSTHWDIYCVCPKSEVVWVDKCIVTTVHRYDCKWQWIPPGFTYKFAYTWHVWIKEPKLVTMWYDWRKQLLQGFGMLWASPPMPVNYNGFTLPGFEGAFLLDPSVLIMVAAPVLQQNGLASLVLPIPKDPAWVGVRINLQAVGIDSTFKSGSFSEVSEIVFRS